MASNNVASGQYSSAGSDSGASSIGTSPSARVMGFLRERPVAAAAVAAGAAAAGLFLWSKRSHITDQLSSLSDQIGGWTDTIGTPSSSAQFASSDGTRDLAT